MAATSAPKVKKVLLELLEANIPNANIAGGVQIRYAHPGADIQQEAIYFNRTISREEAAALGRLRRDEDYEIEVVIDVAQDGDNAQLCEERCWTLVEELENLVRANPGKSGDAMAGAVDGWVVYHSTEMTPHIEQAARLAEAVCTIAVKNRK